MADDLRAPGRLRRSGHDTPLGPSRCRGSLLLAVALLPAAVGAETIQGQGGTVLRAAAGRAFVESAAGGEREVALPAGAALEALVETADGWVGVGTVGRNGGSELLLVRERFGRAEPLAPPARRFGALRGGAVPLVHRGILAGLAWLEGEGAGALTVRAAERVEEGWREAGPVSASADQVALRGAVLADGAWLLVWARVAGHDSDLVWSRRDASGWSAPRPLHADNDRPDILPALAATEDGGAVVAWSRYDGEDYRLHLARYDGEGWWELAVDSERGAGDPSFVRVDGALHLLYKAVVPDRWSVVRLDRSGVPVARGAVAEERYARPVVAPGPTLLWEAADGAPGRRDRVRMEPPR